MYLDHTIGELVEYLETNGWMENSIIVVASDNGGCPSCGGSNYPLRGIKHSYWEGGTKVTTVVCYRYRLCYFAVVLGKPRQFCCRLYHTFSQAHFFIQVYSYDGILN